MLWEFSLRLLDGKGKLDWFRVFECWLLDFADIVLKTVIWVWTSFLIISSFVQRFFFRKDIFSSKDFSCWLGRLLLTSLFKYLEKRNPFVYSRGPIHDSQIYLIRKFWALLFLKLSSMLEADIEVRRFSVIGVWMSLVIGISVPIWIVAQFLTVQSCLGYCPWCHLANPLWVNVLLALLSII